MTHAQTFRQALASAWSRLSRPQQIFTMISFLLSVGFTTASILPPIISGQWSLLNILSMIMSLFGFLGTWTMAIQWQHTFKLNAIQNIAGIGTAGLQKVYGDMFTSAYYLLTEFIGNHAWKHKRDQEGQLMVDKRFGWRDILIAVFFWTIGLGLISRLMGGKSIVLDALTNGLAFTAQQRQIKGHLDGYYLWILVNLLSFIMFFSLGNTIVALSYLSMLMQVFVGIMVWKNGHEDTELS